MDFGILIVCIGIGIAGGIVILTFWMINDYASVRSLALQEVRDDHIYGRTRDTVEPPNRLPGPRPEPKPRPKGTPREPTPEPPPPERPVLPDRPAVQLPRRTRRR